MRMSRLFGRTLRDVPADVEVESHALLLRAGFVRPLAAGIFSLLPLGRRSQDRLERLLRAEMDAIGGQELTMPVVQPAELWRRTGRLDAIGPELGRLEDRYGRPLVLAMTHEEVVAALAQSEISSWRQLPALVYHLQTKWRDDARPRAGLIRVREFTMLDSYSLDADEAGLAAQYGAHDAAYRRIFARCGLPVTVVEADTGAMGGQASHEYMYLSPIGEDTLLLCDACGYTANRQVARLRRETPEGEEEALRPVDTPGAKTIAELAAFLDVPERATAKAVFLHAELAPGEGERDEPPAGAEGAEGEGDGAPDGADDAAVGGAKGTARSATTSDATLVLVVVRGDMEVNETKVAALLGARALRPATEEEIRAVGAVPGYASPVGLKRGPGLRVLVDETAAAEPALVAGANEEGRHLLGVRCGRDFEPDRVADLVAAAAGDPCPDCGAAMRAERGVEVGNIFQLGTRYTEALEATYTDAEGALRPIIMGSYGIGVGRTLQCVAEAHRDERGLRWPITVAPYDVHLVALRGAEAEAEALYGALRAAGLDVLWDDRDERPGVKFNDADLIGIPLRLTLGARSLEQGGAEWRRRDGEGEGLVPLADAPRFLAELAAEMRAALEPEGASAR